MFFLKTESHIYACSSFANIAQKFYTPWHQSYVESQKHIPVKQSLYFHAFFSHEILGTEKLYSVPVSSMLQSIETEPTPSFVLDWLHTQNTYFQAQSQTMSVHSYEQYKTVFADCMTDLQENIYKKIVPFSIFTYPLDDSLTGAITDIQKDEWFVHWALHIATTQTLPVYGLQTPKLTMIGCTPETLFHIKNQSIYTHALAGTVDSRQVSVIPDSLTAEHNIVVSMLIEALQPVVSSLTIHPKTHLYFTPWLYHIQTCIEGVLAKDSLNMDRSDLLKHIIDALHPTAAVGGFPKPAIMAVLRSWQQKYGLTRSVAHDLYGSPIVLDTGTEVQAFVALRNVQIVHSNHKSYAEIRCGGGLVANSQLDYEWQELLLKQQSIIEKLFPVQT
jgi:isochorismate synthase EntC